MALFKEICFAIQATELDVTESL